MTSILLQSLKIDLVSKTISGTVDETEFPVEGTIGRKDRVKHTRPVTFTITDDEEVKTFQGKIDVNLSHIYGTWTSNQYPEPEYFDFRLGEPVPADL